MRIEVRACLVVLLALAWPTEVWATCDCEALAAKRGTSAPIQFWGRLSESKQAYQQTLVKFAVVQSVGSRSVHGTAEFRISKQCPISVKRDTNYLVHSFVCADSKHKWCLDGCSLTRPLARPPEPGEVYDDVAALDTDESRRLELEVAQALRECPRSTRERTTFMVELGGSQDPLLVEPSTAELDCVGKALLSVRAPRQLVSVSGSIDWKPRPPSVDVDVWDCAEAPWTCLRFGDALLEKLLVVEAPMSEAQVRLFEAELDHLRGDHPSIEIARQICGVDGFIRAESFALEHGFVETRGWNASFDAMAFECAMALGDYRIAQNYVDGAAQGALAGVVLDWAAVRDGQPLPLRRAEPTFLESARTADETLTPVLVRQQFARSAGWVNNPVFLEAFAESIAGDERAPSSTRILAAVAYRKAALLRPEATVLYTAFARELATDDETADALATLQERFDAALAAHGERAAATAEAREDSPEQRLAPVPVAPPSAPKPPASTSASESSDRDPMLPAALVICALLAVLFLTRRRSAT